MWRLNRVQRSRGLAACRGVALEFVFEHEENALLARGFRCGPELFINRGAIGCDIVDAPEIEAPDLVGLEGLGERDRFLEDLVLLLECGLRGVMQIAL